MLIGSVVLLAMSALRGERRGGGHRRVARVVRGEERLGYDQALLAEVAGALARAVMHDMRRAARRLVTISLLDFCSIAYRCLSLRISVSYACLPSMVLS